MKKCINITLIATLILTVTSCNEWLDVLPENDQVADEFWQNKEEVEAVLSAIYLKYRDTQDDQIVWGEMRGNALTYGTSVTGDRLRLKDWNITPDNSYCDWGTWYQIINLSNMIIEYSPQVRERDASFTQEIMNSYMAEAYYLRALSYFFLVRNFRDVPLILEPYQTDDQDYEIPKSDEMVIWDQIEADLLIAEEGTRSAFPEVMQTKGRATKWAVKATLADVYLWTEQYDKAIIACNDIINARVGGVNQFALISGVANETENNWFTIFSEGNTPEGIFEIQWNSEAGENNNSLFNWFYGATFYDYQITQDTYELFQMDENDLRGAFVSYTVPDLLVWKYIGKTCNPIGSTATNAGAQRTSDQRDQNWIMYRMADVFLMKAEALVMLNQFDEATEIVNRIRARANAGSIENLGEQLAMLDLVLDERILEFVAEGKRWYDLLRVAKRNNYQYLDYMIGEVLKSATSNNALIIRSILRDPDSHYLPISFSELTNNQALEQNPYYESLN